MKCEELRCSCEGNYTFIYLIQLDEKRSNKWLLNNK